MIVSYYIKLLLQGGRQAKTLKMLLDENKDVQARRRVKRVLMMGKARRWVRRVSMMGKARRREGAQFSRLFNLPNIFLLNHNTKSKK